MIGYIPAALCSVGVIVVGDTVTGGGGAAAVFAIAVVDVLPVAN